MRRCMVPLGLAAAFNVQAGAPAVWREAAVAAPASRLALPDWRGQRRDLDEFRGKVVLVNFWASWCEPCRDELPELEDLRHRYATRGLEVVAVNLGEGEQRIAGFVRSYLPDDMALVMLRDGNNQVYKQWRVRAVPASFLIDRQGRVRWHALGRIDVAGADTVERIETLLTP